MQLYLSGNQTETKWELIKTNKIFLRARNSFQGLGVNSHYAVERFPRIFAFSAQFKLLIEEFESARYAEDM